MGMECESVHEHCAVAGCTNHNRAAEVVRRLLISQQNRGQEISGMVGYRGRRLHQQRLPGLVRNSFGIEQMSIVAGDPVIGHNRYSTAGASNVHNSQPHVLGDFAYCANGDIPRCQVHTHRTWLERRGKVLQTQNDGELVLAVLSAQFERTNSIEQSVRYVIENVHGAYSSLLIAHGRLYGFRDIRGMRPLIIGTYENSYIFASETRAFQDLQAKFVGEVKPGELVSCSLNSRVLDRITLVPSRPAHCVFELIYFAFPTSKVFGIPVSRFRRVLGQLLATKTIPSVDVVISIPDSSNLAAIALSEEVGIGFDCGIIRDHYAMGRSFISPDPETRILVARTKLIPDSAVLNGRRVLVVDDSIVRGTTTKEIVSRLRDAGATEVHLMITSPPIRHSCYYGVDTPNPSELIAHGRSADEVALMLGLDTLVYLSPSDLTQALSHFGFESSDFCMACFTGEYPTEI